MIVQIRFRTDPGAFSPYRDAFLPLAARHGARPLATGGQVDVLEGAHDGRAVAVFEFPTLEAIHEFWDSPAYQDIKRLRKGVADLDIWAVAGPDPSAP